MASHRSTYKYDSTEQRTIPCNPTDDGASYNIHVSYDY